MLRNFGIKAAFVAALATPVVLLATSCDPECVDKFDCYSKITASSPNWTCQDNKCVVGNPDPCGAGGSGAGCDAGTP